MQFTTKLINLYFAPRRQKIEQFRQNGSEIQYRQLKGLVEKAKDTEFGRLYNFAGVRDYDDFRRQVPVTDYEDFSHWIERSKAGEKNLIWPSPIKWYAKSSGTTGAKSKYIPVTDEGLKESHLQGPRDVIALFSNSYPETKVFMGKTLTLGGSKRIEREGETAFSGDLSAILLENTPVWANMRRVPSVETALLPDFEQKVERICRESVGQNVTSFAGVPSWNLVMLNKVLDFTGKRTILDVWPDMELFIYGGMNFKPYREEYRKILPTEDMKYMETYNASEGFFSIGDEPTRDDMLLMLDYNTFYEFVPVRDLPDTTNAVPIEGVEEGINYAIIITSSNGLWRYMIGDTVEFTSVRPHRIRITGRTKHYINAFGEELVIENAEGALREACDRTGAEIAEFTAAPVYMEGRIKGAHEWVIEFKTPPWSLELFTETLDTALQSRNSDYEAKRFKDTTLLPPRITVVPEGAFLHWLESNGKTGGQNKVPRLFNDRRFVDEITSLIATLA